MKIVVTGGAGFIGSNLCDALLQRGDEVVAIDNLSTGRPEFVESASRHDAYELVQMDLLDAAGVTDVVDGADAVVHLAARSSVPRSVAHPVAAHEANATGTIRVLEAARRAGGIHVIVASSSSVYGANETLPKHEGLATRPVSPYAASKLATEAYTLAWGHAYDLPVLALRFFNIFGPRQPPLHAYAAAIPSFLAAAFRGEPLPVHGDGTQSRDFTYVATVVDVLTRAIVEQVGHPEPVNLAFGTRVSLLEVIAEMERILGRDLPVDHHPLRVGDVPRSQADSSTLRSLFPEVEPTPLPEGLEATVRWFEEARPWERPAD